MKKLTVFLVDDHAVVRAGTREILAMHPQIEVVGEADSGENLEALLNLKQPDILLLDINLPGDNGLVLLEKLKPLFPALKIVLFTAHTDLQYIKKGLSLKADGYLSKTLSPQSLQLKLIQLMEAPHQAIYSPDVVEKIATLTALPQAELTPREIEILLQVAQGQTNQAIAKALVVSVKTVDTHVANLMKKLAVKNRSLLTAYAYEHGYL